MGIGFLLACKNIALQIVDLLIFLYVTIQRCNINTLEIYVYMIGSYIAITDLCLS